MSFDLRRHAATHRYRLRNLHDGAPTPPARRPRRPGKPATYRGREDRFDAIVCRDGYVHADGCEAGQIGVCVLCRSGRALRARLRLLDGVGATVTQLGESEAAGFAPANRIDDVLRALRAYRRREGVVGARAPGRQTLGGRSR